MSKQHSSDLDTERIDDRWTLDKLRRAGYQLEWERSCRSCGDQIEGYRQETTQRILVLDAAVLSVHDCGGH